MLQRRKYIISISVIILFFLLFIPEEASASLVVVNNDGTVTLNVLSSQASNLTSPKRESVEIKKLAYDGGFPYGSQVSLLKNDDKVELEVEEGEEIKKLDVTDFSDDLIEIEEREEVQKIKIKLKGDKFGITQGKIEAQTEYPIMIDPKNAEISVSTPSGTRFLSILPGEALISSFRSKSISDLGKERNILLMEEGSGVLVYKIDGVRAINVFNLFEYKVPVSANISATNGEVVSVDQPPWLKVLGFLFVYG